MSSELPSTTRLEAFSDGVIAVIITIMVLELKVPHQNGAAGLLVILPTLFVYALSFTFTGIYWINHHHLLDRIHHANHRILYSNLVFLFSLSLLPFFTSWVLDKQIDAFSVALYAVSLALTGFGFFLLRLAVDCRLHEEGSFAPENTAEQRKHVLSLILYLIAIPLAFFHARIALADLALVTLVWIVPTATLHPALPTSTVPRSPSSISSSNVHPSKRHPDTP